jgi:hypothetical protein
MYGDRVERWVGKRNSRVQILPEEEIGRRKLVMVQKSFAV